MTSPQALTAFWIEFGPWPPEVAAGRIPPFPVGCGVTASSLQEALDFVHRGFYENRELPPVVSVSSGVDRAPGDWAGGQPVPTGQLGIWYPVPLYPDRTVLAVALPDDRLVRIVADITLTPRVKGGRRHPISTGYRATWDNGDRTTEGDVAFHDGVVMMSADTLAPGQSAVVEIYAVNPGFWAHVVVGSRLRAFEGRQEVAIAEVREVRVE